ncbi:MAG TPA: class I adenylate-forming enzyme family protein [Caulobacteraceae bacterium]|nr:class I adenylate-forming enzyme family protein [Caulobacteraceae bacterium]
MIRRITWKERRYHAATQQYSEGISLYTVDAIYRTCHEAPTRTALVYNLEPISYRAFYARIAAMIAFLDEQPLRPGGVAVVWIDHILVSWLVDLALRSLGHTTLSIRSASELSELGDLDVVAFVTLAGEGHTAQHAAALSDAPRVEIHRGATLPLDTTLEPPAPPVRAEGEHIMLTSGTTGHYKMVLYDLERQAQARELGEAMVADHRKVSDRPPMLHLFDFGLWTAAGYGSPPVLWSLGCAVAFHQGADKARSLDVPGLTHAMVTPALLADLMAAPEGAFRRNDDLSLRIIAGALSEDLYNRATARLTRKITTTVGSTEGGAIARTTVNSAEDLRWHKLDPDAVVEVVDENDRPLPPGKLGQLRVRQAEGVDRYINDADASAAAFRDGWFYPGDLAVLDGQRRLSLLGRVTDVINVRGDKHAARPFEEALESDLGAAVCLLSEQAKSGAEELHAVIETPAPIDEATLQAVAAHRLAGFGTIHFHFVDRLPRNHLGKVERFKLRASLAQHR